MTVYQELGKTAEELEAYGASIVKSLMFRNEPYDHFVFVVGDELEFAAVAQYVMNHIGAGGMIDNYDRYKQSAGLTVNWKYRNTVYSLIGIHCRDVNYYHISTLMSFLGTTIHEQQHMLTRIERETGADHRYEDEPRTYSTNWTFNKIMAILQKNWGINLIASPDWMIPRARTLDEVCHLMGARIPRADIYSGVITQYMASHTGVVQHNKDSWRAVTYLSGGNDV